MIFPDLRPFSLVAKSFALVAMAVSVRAELPGVVKMPEQNPISRIARLFDPNLVDIEERVLWLDRRVSTYAQLNEIPLRFALGYRGSRADSRSADPTVTLDLGTERPVDSIFLIPAQREFVGDSGMFPTRFTIELSNDEDFAQRSVLYTTGTTPYLPPDAIPQFFKGKGSARYVRLTVQQGHEKGQTDLFGLSEFAVISNGEPVSFNATVTTSGALNVGGIWFPEALVDGQTPLGIWHNGVRPIREPGDRVDVGKSNQSCVWTIPLKKTVPLDRVVLFPYPFHRSAESRILPHSMELLLVTEDPHAVNRVWVWSNPLPSGEHPTPLVIPLAGRAAQSIQLISKTPWQLGEDRIHALSEIEAWSGGINYAAQAKVTREFDGQSVEISALTDGSSSDREIITFSQWLRQLNERGAMERELAQLRPRHRQIAARDELNATWGLAVALGLTFLIPVFIFERRRLMSREQLDLIRKRIASDLHDDIGSNLGSISMIARTARRDLVRLNGPEEVAEDLSEVETIARESSLAMRDIVWLLERHLDSVGDLIQRMRETASRLMRELDFSLNCQSEKTTARLSLDAKRHLFLFYKEALHNILKHSKASQVTVNILDDDDLLCIEIIDNGIGLPSDPGQHPAAMNKLKDRARLLRGNMEVSSSTNQGTRIRLSVRRSHLTSQPTHP